MGGADGRRRVVIVGGGFAGMYAAQRMAKAPVEITLIDKRNFHLFQPLLYQVATGALSPANIASPLRGIFKRQKNCRVVLGEVTDFDVDRRRVILADGEFCEYDELIVATGAGQNYFGNEQWAPLAPGLKTVEDATEIRRRVLLAFESAEREDDSAIVDQWMTFVMVGAGPTGVELAGAVAEVARDTLRHEFRNIEATKARVVLMDMADRILPMYHETLSAKAEQQLEDIGVEVLTGAMVTEIEPEGIHFKRDDAEHFIASRTVLWGAGVKASPLGKKIAAATGAETDKAGRVTVTSQCTAQGHDNIFVLGDLAQFKTEDGGELPGVAQVAMQQGKYVARLIQKRMEGESVGPFKYHDRGSMSTIGRAAAVADVKGWRFGGWFAWLAWLFIHLMYLVEFQNRLLVLLQWAWNYFTFNRSARLITGMTSPPIRSKGTEGGVPTTPTTPQMPERAHQG